MKWWTTNKRKQQQHLVYSEYTSQWTFDLIDLLVIWHCLRWRRTTQSFSFFLRFCFTLFCSFFGIANVDLYRHKHTLTYIYNVNMRSSILPMTMEVLLPYTHWYTNQCNPRAIVDCIDEDSVVLNRNIAETLANRKTSYSSSLVAPPAREYTMRYMLEAHKYLSSNYHLTFPAK